MRLVNTLTFQVEQFLGGDVPAYAILSHTWGDDEVTLHDMTSGAYKEKAGFSKIRLCCEQARIDSFKWAWIDTCCIDKTSSAELSEAINSMYLWYKNAAVCYAFLIDTWESLYDDDSPSTCSRWFTRSWTLQELLAPATVIFYDRDWSEIGTVTSLAPALTEITKIPSRVLCHQDSADSCCVAERLSWAAHRRSTRSEDRAYSLLGLFDINMPLLYGEGDRAFARLQREIINTSQDLSIFAWSRPLKRDTDDDNDNDNVPAIDWLLAESLDDFGNLARIDSEWCHAPLESAVALTPFSIEIDLPLQLSDDGKHALAYTGYRLTDRDGPLQFLPPDMDLQGNPQEYLCVQLFQHAPGVWLRHQEITVLHAEHNHIKEDFQITRLKFTSGKFHVFISKDGSVSTGVLPFKRRMPTMILKVTSNCDTQQPFQARLRYMIETTEGPEKQELVTKPYILAYAVVTSDRTQWQKFTDVVLAEVRFSIPELTDTPVILTPHFEELRFGTNASASIAVLEILSGEQHVILEMALVLHMTANRVLPSFHVVPLWARDDILRIWNLRMARESDKMGTTADHPDGSKTYRVMTKIRPTGCRLHQPLCQCKTQLLHVHVDTVRDLSEPTKGSVGRVSGSQGFRRKRKFASSPEPSMSPTITLIGSNLARTGPQLYITPVDFTDPADPGRFKLQKRQTTSRDKFWETVLKEEEGTENQKYPFVLGSARPYLNKMIMWSGSSAST